MQYKLKRNFILDVTKNADHWGEIFITPHKEFGYNDGDIVCIQAQEKPGFIFTGWEGDYITSKKTLTITITKDIRLKAHFYPLDSEPDYKIPTSSPITIFLLILTIAFLSSLYIKKSIC